MKNYYRKLCLFLCFILFEVVVLETMGLEKRRGCIFHLTLHSYFNVASTSSSVFFNTEASLFMRMRYGNFVVVLMIIFLIAAFPGVVFSSYPMLKLLQAHKCSCPEKVVTPNTFLAAATQQACNTHSVFSGGENWLLRKWDIITLPATFTTPVTLLSCVARIAMKFRPGILIIKL